MSHSTPGVRHARATRSAFALRPGPFKVYMALRYLIADGATVDITQAEIATVADVSESTVNTAVRELAADDDTPGLITLERVARTDVRGTRWQITMHAPPELVASSGAWHGSAADRPTPAPVQPVRAPQTAPAEGSATDRHEDHDQYLQQQQDRAPTAPALNRDQQLLYTALRAHPTIGHTVAMRLITQYPDRTPDDFARDLRNADRPGVKNPLAVTLHCWLDGAAVWEPRTPTEAPMDRELQDLIDATGFDDATARHILRQQQQAAQRPAGGGWRSMQDLEATITQLRQQHPSLTSPPSTRKPPSDSAAPRNGAASPRERAPVQRPAVPGCTCNGARWVVSDARVGDPQFGQLVPCACLLAERQQRVATQQQARQQQLLGQLTSELGALAGCTFAGFAVDWCADAAARRSLAQARAAAELYAQQPSSWLYLYGVYGCGKSHLAAAVANVLGRERRAAYAAVPRLLRFVQAGFGQHGEGSADARIQALCDAELLVLDDLGKEYLKGERDGRPGWAEALLFDVIDHRYINDLPTVITSNQPIDDHPGAIADRIAGMALVVPIAAPSYRRR